MRVITLACTFSHIKPDCLLKYSMPNRYCSKCKLVEKKQCTPESTEGECCADTGLFARGTKCSLNTKMPGYCKLGSCLTYFCFSSDGSYSFCAPSKAHTCTAKCEGFHTTNICYSREQVSGPGARIITPNGAICSMSGHESQCSYGPCAGMKAPSTSSTSA